LSLRHKGQLLSIQANNHESQTIVIQPSHW